MPVRGDVARLLDLGQQLVQLVRLPVGVGERLADRVPVDGPQRRSHQIGDHAEIPFKGCGRGVHGGQAAHGSLGVALIQGVNDLEVYQPDHASGRLAVGQQGAKAVERDRLPDRRGIAAGLLDLRDQRPDLLKEFGDFRLVRPRLAGNEILGHLAQADDR